MNRKWLNILFWGAAWGIAEATLGYVLHLAAIALPGLPGLVMFPVAFYFMRRVYLENDEPRAVFYAAAVAAGIKMADFMIPGSIPLRIINPALSILMEGLAVAAVFAYCRMLKRPLGFPESFASGVLWRLMWAGHLLLISLFSLPAELVTSGPLIIVRFLFFESLVNAVLILGQIRLISPGRAVSRRPVLAYGTLLFALILQSVI